MSFAGGSSVNIYRNQKGIALILSMIFLAVFTSFAVALASMSMTNVQIAENHQKANRSRAAAESGLEIMRYWLSQVSIKSGATNAARFSAIKASLDTSLTGLLSEGDVVSLKNSELGALEATLTECGVTNLASILNDSNIKTILGNSESHILVPSVDLGFDTGNQFFAVLLENDGVTFPLYVFGYHDEIQRCIGVNVKLAFGVFDFGVATKGPLDVGNMTLTGLTTDSEADVYIESFNILTALELAPNAELSGGVQIAYAKADVTKDHIKGTIKEETGTDAIANHVQIGVPTIDFPIPDPEYFRLDEIEYSLIIDESFTPGNGNGAIVIPSIDYDNILIKASPDVRTIKFNGGTITGIVFIESGNNVEFAGNLTSTATFIGNGSYTDNSGSNKIRFTGTVNNGASDQPEISIMAPGFSVTFGGNFSTLSGGICANGISFSGTAGGTVKGSVINYSNVTMTMAGDGITFDRSNNLVPSGFKSGLFSQMSSYSEL
jgi:hypothetical protein